VQRSDNFTRINGIGIVFDQRLKAAGIVTFAQLARCTPAEIAKIVLWPEGRIRSSAIIEQAQALADEQG
jgi:predicted flap endonuclease-1-like 5' DNA nuclease